MQLRKLPYIMNACLVDRRVSTVNHAFILLGAFFYFAFLFRRGVLPALFAGRRGNGSYTGEIHTRILVEHLFKRIIYFICWLCLHPASTVRDEPHQDECLGRLYSGRNSLFCCPEGTGLTCYIPGGARCVGRVRTVFRCENVNVARFSFVCLRRRR